jgi:hypothetical protein
MVLHQLVLDRAVRGFGSDGGAVLRKTLVEDVFELGKVAASLHPVDYCYKHILEREPDAEGRAFWIDQYEGWQGTMPDFWLAFIRGIE